MASLFFSGLTNYRGMSNALGGAGGGGLLNTTQSTNANVAVYTSMSVLSKGYKAT